jgi:hypothetical protein
MNDAANRLREIHQNEVMPDGTKVVHDTNAHYQRIQALINELPIDTPYDFSVIECFHNSLTQSIRDQIKADGIQMPSTALMQNVEQLDALSAYVQHAKNAENKIKNISRIANASSGQNRGPNRGNIFLANAGIHNNPDYGDDYSNQDTDDFISEDPYQGTPHGFLANHHTKRTAEANVLHDMMLTEAEQDLQQSHCFLSPGMNRYTSGSPANSALAQASNMPYPLECWGCCNHSDPKRHADRYHPWRNFPHKLDPENAKNAKKGLSEYWKKQDNKRRGLATQWKKIGLPNQECGVHLHAIASPRNSTAEKKVAVAAMMKSMLASTRDHTPSNDNSNQRSLPLFDFGETSNGGNYPAFIATKKNETLSTFIAMAKPKVFQSMSAKKRFKMPVSESLPQMKFRIGGKDSKFGLEVACNMRLSKKRR